MNAFAGQSLPTSGVGGTQSLPAGVRRLFQTQEYRFQFGMRRGDYNWFDPSASDPAVLSERAHWIRQTPDRCIVWLPEASTALSGARALFPQLPASLRDEPPSASACGAFSSQWEPDFLLLERIPDGGHRLVGGCVCFPSAWRVTEKIGLDVTAIHDVVPTLNAELGSRIHRFLNQLRPGQIFERENWGLAAHSELNAHPDRGLPRLSAETPLDQVSVRVEHQAFVALPADAGLLFLIRMVVYPMRVFLKEPDVARDLRRMLASMPEEIAEYKGIGNARESLVRQLDECLR